MLLNQYSSILFLIFIAVAISTIIVVASYIFAVQTPDSAKLSSYECGFDPMGSPRQQFEIRFFLVGILFIVFDIEVTLILPFALVISNIPLMGFTSILAFIIILTLGLVYE
jgi:NADH:ubiquinone oxidoreductase subunit 3 (subunit A)